MIEQTYTVDQAAKILCCPTDVVYDLFKTGELEQIYTTRKSRAVRESALLNYMETHNGRETRH